MPESQSLLKTERMLQHMAVRVCALAAVVVTQARLVAGWRLGTSLEVVDGQEIRNHYNKIELDSNRLVRPFLCDYCERACVAPSG